MYKYNNYNSLQRTRNWRSSAKRNVIFHYSQVGLLLPLRENNRVQKRKVRWGFRVYNLRTKHNILVCLSSFYKTLKGFVECWKLEDMLQFILQFTNYKSMRITLTQTRDQNVPIYTGDGSSVWDEIGQRMVACLKIWSVYKYRQIDRSSILTSYPQWFGSQDGLSR